MGNRMELTSILKAETNCERRQEEHQMKTVASQSKYASVIKKKTSYRCLVTPPFRSGRGWHIHCHTSGQRRIGRTWHAWVHFCGGQASATAVRRWHEESLSSLPPEEKTQGSQPPRCYTMIVCSLAAHCIIELFYRLSSRILLTGRRVGEVNRVQTFYKRCCYGVAGFGRVFLIYRLMHIFAKAYNITTLGTLTGHSGHKCWSLKLVFVSNR